MRSRTALATIVGLSVVASSLVAAPAAAGVPTTGLDACENGTSCTFQIGGFDVVSDAEAQIIRGADGSTRIVGSIDLPTPAGPLPLLETDMLFEPGASGSSEFVRGVAKMPFPTELGVDPVAVPMAEFGIQRGNALAHLGAHLNDDTEYLYFHADSGLALPLPWGDEPWTAMLPNSVPIHEGAAITVVLDPTDPYFYIGGTCPALPAPPDDDQRDDAAHGSDTRDGDRASADPDGPAAAPDHDAANEEERADEEQVDEEQAGGEEADAEQQDESELPKLDVELTDPDAEDVGPDCGIGFSAHGRIPAPAANDRPAVSGHVVIDAPMPIGPTLELDGTLVVAFDQGVRATGYGDLSATIPLPFVDVSLPVGAAIVTIDANAERIGYGFEGRLATEDAYQINGSDLEISLPGDAEITVASSFGFAPGSDGVWRVEPDGFFEARGEIGFGPDIFSDLAGVELDDFASAKAALRIDRHGVWAAGEMDAQIHPSVATDGGTEMELWVSFDDPAESFFVTTGNLQIAGAKLAAGQLSIGRDGFFVRGMLSNTLTTVEMTGSITADGAQLSGRAALELPFDALGAMAQDTVDAVDAAQADVDRIEVEIERTRQTILAERLVASTDLIRADAALGVAQRAVASVQSSIDKNNSKIRYLKGRISKEKRRYKRLSRWNRFRQVGRYVARVGSWSGAIGGLHAANRGLVASRTIAHGSLAAARTTVTAIEQGIRALPVDVDPRIAGLYVARDVATATLQTTRAVAAPFASISGELRAEAAFSIGTAGLSGALSAEWCTDVCSPLASASLSLESGPTGEPGWRGCIGVVPKTPAVCGWM